MEKKKLQFMIMLCVVGIILPVLSVCAQRYEYEPGIVMNYDLNHNGSKFVARTYNSCAATPKVSLFAYDSNGTALRSDLQLGKWNVAAGVFLASVSVSDSKAKSAKSAHVLLRTNDSQSFGQTIKLTLP